MKKILLFLSTTWVPMIVVGTSLVIIFGLYFHKIGSLTKEPLAIESASQIDRPTFTSIYKNPVNAPYFLARNTALHLHPKNSVTVSRILSVFIGLITLGLFYLLLCQWYKPKVVFLGTVLMASSSWLLRTSRMAIPEVQQSLTVAIIFLFAWLQQTHKRKTGVFATLLVLCIAFYIPILSILVAAALVWKISDLKKHLSSYDKPFLSGIIVFALAVMAPLVVGIIIHPTYLLQLVGVPDNFSVTAAVRNIVDIPYELFVRGSANILRGVGHMPILDVFTAAMIVLGVIDCIKSFKLDRSKITIGLLIVGFLASIISNQPMLAILIPAIYLLAANGMSYVLTQWLNIFPKNPIARILAVSLVSVAVATTAYYNIHSYYDAWPKTIRGYHSLAIDR